MAGVWFDPAVGGDGSTVTDDAHPATGLQNYGWVVRFVPALTQQVAVAAWMKDWTLVQKTAIDASATAAGTSATDAAASAQAAANSAGAASASATSAGASATTAATQAGQASASATAAAASASAASTSELNAAASATAAGTSATDAATSEQAASNSATAASASATSAGTSATTATTQADQASASATDAAASANAASSAKTAAEAARDKAQAWADANENVPVEAGRYSAKHWAARAEQIATGALIYMGAFDAAANGAPGAPALGHYYKISGAGSVGGTLVVAIGDSIIYNGTGWDKIDSTDAVTSVAGRVGAVVLTKDDVGLSAVDNTSDADKPVSTATQAALNGKAESSHTHADATTSVAGFMSAADKTKLNGVATSANNYSHPTGDGNLHVPATGTTNNGKVLKAGSTAGSLSWGTLSYTDVGAAAASHTHNYAGSASAGGAAASVAQILTRGTGLTGNNFNGSAATTWAVAYGTTAGTACQGDDSRLSNSRPASDVYAWAKASVKPTYTAAEVGAAASSHTHSYLPLSGGSPTGDIVFGDSDRDHSPMGTYNPAKTQQIWSMGTAYRSSATGVDFGSLYGLAYKHTNNATGGTMAGGHQMVWVQAGVPKCALGDGFWTAGYSFLGESSPGIKLKKLTTTTPVLNNGTRNVAHGLTGSKILQAFATIEFATGEWGVPNTDTAGYECRIRWDNTNIILNLVGTNSASITDKPVTITIIYEA